MTKTGWNTLYHSNPTRQVLTWFSNTEESLQTLLTRTNANQSHRLSVFISSCLVTIKCVNFCCTLVVETIDYKIRSKSYDWKDTSGKYLARTVRPPKYRPSSSRTVFQAPTGPEKRTKIRTASSALGGVGYTGCTTTLSTVPFLEHSSPVEKIYFNINK